MLGVARFCFAVIAALALGITVASGCTALCDMDRQQALAIRSIEPRCCGPRPFHDFDPLYLVICF